MWTNEWTTLFLFVLHLFGGVVAPTAVLGQVEALPLGNKLLFFFWLQSHAGENRYETVMCELSKKCIKTYPLLVSAVLDSSTVATAPVFAGLILHTLSLSLSHTVCRSRQSIPGSSFFFSTTMEKREV